jgi:hypothetical protein
MRVARGFFHLWVVVSVFWIVGTVAMMWSTLPDGHWWLNTRMIQAQSADGVIHEFPANTTMQVVDRVLTDYAKQHPQANNRPGKGFVIDPPECAGKNDSECADVLQRLGTNPFLAFGRTTELRKLSDDKLAGWAAVRNGFEWASIPPVLFLVVGSGLGWAFRGFRT